MCKLICVPHISRNILTDPQKLIGEGLYKLGVVKEITVTSSFMDIGEDIRDCQNETTLESCATEDYLDVLIATCNCLPLSIINDRNVRNNEPLQGPVLAENQRPSLQLAFVCHFSIVFIAFHLELQNWYTNI